MSYSADPIINDLVLTIINDGNGSECGMTYAQRRAAAEDGIFEFRAACRAYNRRRMTHYECDVPANRWQIIEAADILQAYYRDHVAEG